jgi:DNA-binding transcriptional ArsR family regulator
MSKRRPNPWRSKQPRKLGELLSCLNLHGRFWREWGCCFSLSTLKGIKSFKTVFQICTQFSPKSPIQNQRRGGYGNKFITEIRLRWKKSSSTGREMSANARPLKYLLGWLIAGTRGGTTRAEIIKTIHETPQNANQLATTLKVDYKTVRYHLEVLEKNHIVTSVGDKYGATYFLTQMMEDNYSVFEEIVKKIWKK